MTVGSDDSDRVVNFHPEEDEYRCSFAPDERVSVVLMEAVASVKGVEPLQLETLDQAADPKSLEALFEDTDATGHREGLVQFHFSGFLVEVNYRTEEICLQPESDVAGSS